MALPGLQTPLLPSCLANSEESPPQKKGTDTKGDGQAADCKEPLRMQLAPCRRPQPPAHRPPQRDRRGQQGLSPDLRPQPPSICPRERVWQELGGMPESRVRRPDTGLREGQRAAQGHTATVRVPRGVRCPHSPLDPGRGVTLRVQGAWKGLWFAGTSPPPHRRAPRLWGVALWASGLQVLAFGVGSDPPFLPPSSGECLEGAFGAPGPRKLGICSLKSQTSPLTAPRLAHPPQPPAQQGPAPGPPAGRLCPALGCTVAQALSRRSRVSPLTGRTLLTPEL